MGCVIITGAAGGIGQALVREFTNVGRPVIGVDIADKPQGCPAAHYIQCDLARTVAERTYANDIFARIRAKLAIRPLDALINNAAIQILGNVEDLDRATWRQTLDVNLLAPFFWSQAFLPELEAAKGCVLNISSIHASLTKSSFVSYASSKAALSGMTRAMAVELGGRVRLNAIEPAAISTPMLRAGFARSPDAYSKLAAYHPTRRIGTPEELANLALYLCDANASFLNGTVISLDGGISARLFDPDSEPDDI